MAHTPYLVEKHHETTGTPGPATTPNSCKELQTVIVGQKGKFKFELEVAYYEKENIIVFMHGLPGPEIEPILTPAMTLSKLYFTR